MKQFSVAMLGFGIAGKAFSRILMRKTSGDHGKNRI